MNRHWHGSFSSVLDLFWPYWKDFNVQLYYVGLRYLAWAHESSIVDKTAECISLEFALVAVYAELVGKI